METTKLGLGLCGALWVAFAAVGCKQLDPVRSLDLCDGEGELSMNCPACRSAPYDARCSVCMRDAAAADDCKIGSAENPLGMSGTDQPQAGEDAPAGPGAGETQGAEAGSNEAGTGRGVDSGSGAAVSGVGGMSLPQAGSTGTMSVEPPGCQSDDWCVEKFPTTPACDLAHRTCVQCTRNDHCGGMLRYCDTLQQRCRNCVTSADCTHGVCKNNMCVECDQDTDCTSDPVKDNCDMSRHVCVDCTSGSGCQDPIDHTCDTKQLGCVDCISNEDCDQPGKLVCDVAERSCVGCLVDRDCQDSVLDSCDKTTKTCVDCVDDNGCRDRDRPRCDKQAQTCVECQTGADCASQHCVAQRCVACEADRDCPTAQAAQCDLKTHSCVPCAADAQCDHLLGTPVCDTARKLCVPCNTDATCNGKACIRSTHMCSTIQVNTLEPCAACQADSQCKSGMRCVPMTYGSAGTKVGSFCAAARGERAGCSSARPYSESLFTTSVDGTTTTYCVPPRQTTCPGVLDATSRLGGKTCSDASDCGAADLVDAICNTSRCTYGCDAAEDCPPQMSCLAAGFCG